MRDTHRRFWLFLLVCIIAMASLLLGPIHDAGMLQQKEVNPTLDIENNNSGQNAMPAMHAALQGFERDTGAGNAVAAVYLQYRLYDTLFEALLLLISVLGILYFLEEKSRDKREKLQ